MFRFILRRRIIKERTKIFFEYSCCNDTIRKLFSIKIKFFGEQKKWDKIKDRNFIDPL